MNNSIISVNKQTGIVHQLVIFELFFNVTFFILK